ncbi:hypothetical protein CTI14_41020, partial [Methylobacterium radiotolerans]
MFWMWKSVRREGAVPELAAGGAALPTQSSLRQRAADLLVARRGVQQRREPVADFAMPMPLSIAS